MRRSFEREILEREDVPEEHVARAYRDLTRIHRVLGDTACLISTLRRDPLPVRRILEIGCAQGGVLRHVRERLGVEVVGVDLRPPAITGSLKIIRADAVRDRLPPADVAFSMYVGHHLSERELVTLIRNVGRSCRRFILLDLVRHPLPLALFRMFVTPFVSPITAADGRLSIRRSYTAAELKRIAGEALAGTGGRCRHSVGPFYTRQIIDIGYRS